MVNKKDLLIIGFIFMILMILFINIDLSYSASCENIRETSDELSYFDVYCVINSEIYEPFIYLFAALWLISWVWVGSLWVIDKIRK